MGKTGEDAGPSIREEYAAYRPGRKRAENVQSRYSCRSPCNAHHQQMRLVPVLVYPVSPTPNVLFDEMPGYGVPEARAWRIAHAMTPKARLTVCNFPLDDATRIGLKVRRLMRGLVKIHRGYHPCPSFRLALAVSVDVANEANTMAFAMNIASNTIVSTTGRGKLTQSTSSIARSVGDDCGERSWRRTPCARPANRVGVSPLPVSWITRFRSNRAAHHSIGRICNRSAPHAMLGSLCLKAADGRGWGPSKSLCVSPSDRRGSTVRIPAG
jgi:hypothetical protein